MSRFGPVPADDGRCRIMPLTCSFACRRVLPYPPADGS